MESAENTDILIIGGGASGLMAAIGAAQNGAQVVVVEKMKRLGLKILASGGERCNVTNTLDQKTFVEHFGRQGRFMIPALELLGSGQLRSMFEGFGIETICKDGFRYFPASHKSQTVLDGLLKEAEHLGIRFELESKVLGLKPAEGGWEITTVKKNWLSKKVVLATGGLTAQALGTTGDGYRFAEDLGHQVADCFPGGVPIRTKQTWPGSCRADTIGKAKLSVDMPKHRKISKVGDIIFTNYGIAGPAVLDLSRELTPLIDKYGSLPLTLTLRPSMSQQDWQDLLQGKKRGGTGAMTVSELLQKKLPASVANALAAEVGIGFDDLIKNIKPFNIDQMAKILTATPLTAIKSMGYKLAFITRGGVKLKDIDSKTLESKSAKGLYLCGEVLDLDGPCGGYNLQWAFASGYLAGVSSAKLLNS